MSSWVVRGGRGGSWESYFLQEGVVGVGWREVGDLQGVTSKQELQELLDVAMPDDPAQKTAQLWAFVGEMQLGDVVVMPHTGSDTVAIGEITGAYRHVEDGRPEVPQVRDVHWLDEAVAKARFATDLRTYFDLPTTLTGIRKARDPDSRLRTVATSELPDGYEAGGPLAEATKPVPFVLPDLEGLPDGPSVHAVWGPDGSLLYIGHSGRPLRERMVEHVRGDRSASILHQRVGELLDERRAVPAGAADIEAYLGECTVAWAVAEDPEATKEQLVEMLSPRFSGRLQGRRYWWVNQGQTYKEERAEGFMWAPLQNKQGTTYAHWSALKQARPGDVVYHYAEGALRAVSVVTQAPQEAPKPLQAEASQQQGTLVGTEYVDFPDPIELEEMSLERRQSESGPFNVKGGVKLGYFFPLNDTFARYLARAFGDRIPTVAPPPPEMDRQVWLFQGNPARFPLDTMFADARIGESDSWAVSQHKGKVVAGDLMMIWVAGQNSGIYALTELVSDPCKLDEPTEFSDTEVEFRWLDILETPLRRAELEQHPVLSNLGVLRFTQGTNYPVSPEEWQAIKDLTGWQEPEPMSMDWLEEQTLWDRDRLEELVATLTDETFQVVLAGPPGTGKTFVGQLVAEYLTGGHAGAQRLVQFHPSYSYEEFIEGLRPVAKDGAVVFRVEPGVVLDMCRHIDRDADQLHVLVIDEMNRANLSSVFGELMYLFEYREREINLRFTRRFALPSPLRFIGTMNTADRSARSLDIALRRRFDVFECPPDRDILERFYKRADNTNHVASLFDGFEALNATLTELRDRHHTIGHTFFMASDFTNERLQHVWEHKILPLLEEYFLDQPDKLEAFTLASFWPEAAP